MATGRSEAGTVGIYPMGHNQITLQLRPSDEVTLKIKPKNQDGGIIPSIANQFRSKTDVTFSGHMLFPYDDVVEEDGIELFEP